MIVLGIESATRVAGAAVVRDGRLLGEIYINRQVNHSEQLLPQIVHLLDSLELTPGDLEGIAVSSGPGSFTGLRIGMATAKGLAYAGDIPLLGVGTLEAMARPLTMLGLPALPMINARRGESYLSLFDGSGRDLTGPVVLDAPGIRRLLNETGERPVFLGDGLEVNRALLEEELGPLTGVPEAFRFPRAAMVAALGEERMLEGDPGDLFGLEPQYVRETEAERNCRRKAGGGQTR